MHGLVPHFLLLPKSPRLPRRPRHPLKLAATSDLFYFLFARSPRVGWLQPLLVGVILVAVVVALWTQRPRWPSPMAVMIWLAGPLLTVFLPQFVLRFRRARAKSPQSPLAAFLAAHRFCGACGYDLHSVEPHPDGCAVCPECGGAWHRDRFVLQDRDPRASSTIGALAAAGHGLADDRTCDDRGVPLAHSVGWPPNWLNKPTADRSIVQQLTHLATTRRRAFRKRWIVPATIAWAALGAGIVLIIEEREPEMLTVVAIVTMLIFALTFYAVERIWIDHAMARAAVDTFGACNNCGALLPVNPPPTFDSCVVCSACQRAWTRSAHPPSPASDGASHH